jgi:predicted permease
MLPILEAIFPVFSLIIIGAIFRRINFPGEVFWPLAEKLVYYALFPALLLSTLANADIDGIPVFHMFWPLASVTCFIAVSLLCLKRYLEVSSASFTSVFQGSIRPNTYIGLAAGAALYGKQGIAIITVTLAIIIPLVNFLSVFVMTFYQPGSHSRHSIPKSLLTVAQNPLIIACAVGALLNKTGIGLPSVAGELFSIFARAALPLGLLSVGASLKMMDNRNIASQLVLPSAMKLLIFPSLTALVCSFVGLNQLVLACMVLFTSLPGSASSYILASQLGGDKELMSSIITVETALAAITIPCLLLIFG